MKKYLVIASSILVLFVILWALFIRNAVPDMQPVYNKIEISSNLINESIFLKRKSWGITSDNEITIISKSPSKEFEPDSTTDFVFNGVSTFLYKQVQDSLFIYVQKKIVSPPKIETKFQIIQIELSNSEIMNLLENDNYKKNGLKLLFP
jgi:hypothetical protein